MSEQAKHTPPPWLVFYDDVDMVAVIHVPRDKTITAIAYIPVDDAEGVSANATGWANARRIVACVNACAGISDDDLEAHAKMLQSMGVKARQLGHRSLIPRARLLIAAPRLLGALKKMAARYGACGPTTGHIHTAESCDTCFAREAIAEAEGTD